MTDRDLADMEAQFDAPNGPEDFITDREGKAEVEPIAYLQDLRRQMTPSYAALKALHGPANRWDARRKAMLSAIKVRVRLDLKQKGEKATDDTVDALAHADEQYQAFIDEGIDGAIAFTELQTRWDEIAERIENRKIELQCYNGEIRL